MAKLENREIMRSYVLDIGPQAMSSKANPRTNNEVPRMPTSVLTLNCSDTMLVAVLKIELAKVMVSVMDDKHNVTSHFLEVGQSCGFLRSFGPSQSTRLGSFSCFSVFASSLELSSAFSRSVSCP